MSPCYSGTAARQRLGPFVALEDGGREVLWPHPCTRLRPATRIAFAGRADCFEPADPEFELAGCPQVGVGGLHDIGYAEGHCCLFCGAVAFWPLWPCGSFAFREQARWHFPNLCARKAQP